MEKLTQLQQVFGFKDSSEQLIQHLRGRHFDFVGQGFGNGMGGHPATGIATDADNGEFASGDFHGRRRVQLANAKKVAEGLGFFFDTKTYSSHSYLPPDGQQTWS